MRKTILTLAAAAVTLATAAPAMADGPRGRGHHGGHHASKYDDRGRYHEPRRLGRNDRVWRGNDGNYHCERENGTTGLIIGGAAGALLGREIDGGQNRTLGTIIGAAGGALLGREIDRGELKCR